MTFVSLLVVQFLGKLLTSLVRSVILCHSLLDKTVIKK